MMKIEEEVLDEEEEELTEKTRKRRKILKKIIRNNREIASDREFDILMNLDKDLFAGYNHHRLGNFCIQENRLELAEENLNRSKDLIEKKFLFTNVYLSLGNLELKRKNNEKACFYFEKVLEMSPHKNSKVYFNKDQVIFAAKLNSFSSYLDAHKNLIKLYVEMKEYEKGFEICKAVTELKELEESAIIEFKDILTKINGDPIEALNFARNKLVEEVKNRGYPSFKVIEPIKINKWEGEGKEDKKEKKINIFTVKWGSKYSYDYVNKLYHCIKRNTSWEIDFYCFTDDHYGIDKNIKVEPLDDSWKKEWGKVVFFDSKFEGKNFYIDLDVVITGNLDQVFEYEGEFGTLRHQVNENDEFPHNGYRSVVMIWKSKKLERMFNKINEFFSPIEKSLVKFDNWLNIIVENADDLEQIYPKSITDFNEKCHQEKPPENSVIVTFPDRPKLSECEVKWVKELWIP